MRGSSQPTASEGRLIGYSLFSEGATDNRPKHSQGDLPVLWGLFEQTYAPRAPRPGDDPKKGLPGLSFATFRPRATRAQQNVLYLDGLLADFDNGMAVETGEYHLGRDGRPTDRPKLKKVCLPEPVQPEAVVAALGAVQVAAMVYTTWSNQPEWPRFRLVVPFANPVPAERWLPATEYAVQVLGLEPFRGGLDLPVLRDTARMHFLPGAPVPASIRRWQVAGDLLTVPLDQLQEIEVPELPRMPWQEAILRNRAGTGSTWSRQYQVNKRPADFQSLNLPALLRAMGVQVGRPQSYSGGTKWRTHCPWASEHTHGLDDDSAVVIHVPGHWPVWKCAHSHHAHLGLRDLLEAFGGAQ